ncbi:MAG: hypothetical protein GY866_42245 [Proteobacteria bacterium]|nr:hypothetical protein [Pseudomonadota bacterium]
MAEVLPEIAASVKGKLTIIADGACRTGYDVVKYLALGADFAMIGRPIARMSIAGGPEAVERYPTYIQSELRRAMLMTGCDDLKQISSNVLVKV